MAQSPAKIKATNNLAERLQTVGTASKQQRSLSTPPTMIELTPATTARVDRLAQPNSEQLDQLAIDAETLRQRSAISVQKIRATQRQALQFTSTGAISASHSSAGNASPSIDPLKQLDLLVTRFNQLAGLQETTLRQMVAIADAEQPHFDPQSPDREKARLTHQICSLCESQSVVVPYIEKDDQGAFALKTRSIDLLQAKREAVAIAQILRDRQDASAQDKETLPMQNATGHEIKRWGRKLQRLIRLLQQQVTRLARRPLPHKSSSATRVTQPASLTLGDMVVWVAGAVLTRIGINALLVAYPGLWFPVIGLIIAPTAIAVYRATVIPQSSYAWGYRLFLIMLGLLIGGRV